MQRQALAWRREGRAVALVPTMGFLHQGHCSLIERAREEVGREGMVVVSIFVNPTQFGPKEDFKRYPRDLKRDLRLCGSAGADVVFAPKANDLYDEKAGHEASTFVVEESISKGMEGASRPGHFRGVATIVAKLFNLVLPGAAIFGEKDYQQSALIRRMVRDMFFPIRIVVSPTRRESDGLALSSRNIFLSKTQRQESIVLWQSIRDVRRAVSNRSRNARSLSTEIRARIESATAGRVDYVEFFDPETLRPVVRVKRGVRMALAVRFGKTRLIDNGLL